MINSPLSRERGLFFGSSPISGEGGPDLEEEVDVVAAAAVMLYRRPRSYH